MTSMKDKLRTVSEYVASNGDEDILSIYLSIGVEETMAYVHLRSVEALRKSFQGHKATLHKVGAEAEYRVLVDGVLFHARSQGTTQEITL